MSTIREWINEIEPVAERLRDRNGEGSADWEAANYLLEIRGHMLRILERASHCFDLDTEHGTDEVWALVLDPEPS